MLLVVATLLFWGSNVFGQAPTAAPVAAAAPGRFKSEPMEAALLTKPAITAMEQARKEGVGKRDLSNAWDKYGAFNAYYSRYVPGKFKDATFIGEIGTLTQGLLDDLDRASKAGSPAAAIIRQSIITIASTIAPAEYHPAARINATLLLALMDDSVEDPKNRLPPVPAAAAFKPLVSLYSKSQFPDGVRAAALQGIARHVSLGAVKAPEYRAGVTKLMMQLATSESPAGRSPEAHAFMQRYAIDILGVLADPNASADTTKTLVALSVAKEKPNLIAAYAASKIATIQPGKQSVEKLPVVLQTWAARAADTIEAELKRIENLVAPLAVRDQPAMPTDDTAQAAMGGNGQQGGYDMGMDGGYGGSMSGQSDYSGMEGMSGMEGDYSGMMDGYGYGSAAVPVAKPQPLEVITSRRRINQVLQQLQLGVAGSPVPGTPVKPTGLLGIATEPDKAAFEKWLTTVNEVVTAINADTLDDRVKYVTELQAQLEVLRALAGQSTEADPNAVAVPAANLLDPLAAPPIGMAPITPGPVASGAAAFSPPAPAMASPVSAAPAIVPAAAGGPAAVPSPAAAAPLVDELQ